MSYKVCYKLKQGSKRSRGSKGSMGSKGWGFRVCRCWCYHQWDVCEVGRDCRFSTLTIRSKGWKHFPFISNFVL